MLGLDKVLKKSGYLFSKLRRNLDYCINMVCKRPACHRQLLKDDQTNCLAGGDVDVSEFTHGVDSRPEGQQMHGCCEKHQEPNFQ